MEFDKILLQVGECGRYQWYILALIFPISMMMAVHNMAMVFLGAIPSHHCQPPVLQNISNPTVDISEILLNQTIPWEKRHDTWERSRCFIYSPENDRNNDSWILEDSNLTTWEQQRCASWLYDDTHYQSTIVTQWDLVCERKWMSATAQSIYMAGFLIGCALFGDLADRFGRRSIILVCTLLQVVFGVVTAFSPVYMVFIILRFLTGMVTAGQKNSAYVMGLEFVGPSYRAEAGMLHEFFWTAGYLFLGMIAYFVRDWRYLQLAITLPGLIFLTYKWLIPESPRWLLTKGRKKEANEIFNKMAKWNGKVVPNVQDVTIKNEDGAGNVLDLVRTFHVRKSSIIIWINWFVTSLVFYGLSFNTANLGGNVYINFLISGAVEVPGYIAFLFFANKIGRRLPLVFGMVLGGLSCLATLAVPNNLNVLSITLAMIGKCCISGVFGLMYLYTTELYPTQNRNIGLGMGNGKARVGGVVAPYINMLGEYSRPLPLLVFGALAISAGLLAIFLPETRGMPLPDTLQQAETFAKERSISCSCKRRSKTKGEVVEDIKSEPGINVALMTKT